MSKVAPNSGVRQNKVLKGSESVHPEATHGQPESFPSRIRPWNELNNSPEN